MPIYVQIVFGALAVFCILSLVKSARTGMISAKQRVYYVDEEPFAFSAVFFFHSNAAAGCVWIATGYDPVEFLKALGIAT